MLEISPEILKKIYYSDNYARCAECRKRIYGVYLRDRCDCKECKKGSDDHCVNLPEFTRQVIVCPFCKIELLFYCQKKNCLISKQIYDKKFLECKKLKRTK